MVKKKQSITSLYLKTEKKTLKGMTKGRWGEEIEAKERRKRKKGKEVKTGNESVWGQLSSRGHPERSLEARPLFNFLINCKQAGKGQSKANVNGS